MKRKMLRLSPKGVANQNTPGSFCDGNGLYLEVGRGKSWVFRFVLNGKERHMGLGPFSCVTLAEARIKALAARKLLLDGIDPIEARNAARDGRALEKARAVTFAGCAAAYIRSKRSDWKNSKHADQWTSTIETYCGPVIGKLPVQDVDTALVVKVLEPIWTRIPETASRLRGRIESVLGWATVSGYRKGGNPARWRGHLDNVLPSLKKKARVKHHPALPYVQVGEFMESLRTQEGIAARALEFTILTATRTGEVVSAQWDEFDLRAGLWTVPASRMKAGREHRVPLSPRAVEIVQTLHRMGDYVFPGRRDGKPLSNMAMLQLLKRMGRVDLTVHGFRSTFRDWTAERTNYPREVCEMALAHTVGDAVEAAYRRGDLFEKRRRLMLEWAKHCDNIKRAGKVVPLGLRA